MYLQEMEATEASLDQVAEHVGFVEMVQPRNRVFHRRKDAVDATVIFICCCKNHLLTCLIYIYARFLRRHIDNYM